MIEEYIGWLDDDWNTVLDMSQPIVRCRDCKYANHYHPLDLRTGRPHETLEEWYCDLFINEEDWSSDVEPDGFCAWGEVSE